MSPEELYQPAWNFLGLPQDLAARQTARGWILPIPYESTTSYGAGTREGPAAILAASRGVGPRTSTRTLTGRSALSPRPGFGRRQ